jgi:hypothetical protein
MNEFSNANTAFVLAELHMQNELLYALVNKDAKNKPIPNSESIMRLYHFYLQILNDPANTDGSYQLPLRQYIRADKTHDNMTLLENLEARDAGQEEK